MFMNKCLTLTPTANFASRHLQFHSSLGCVQPCTVYHCFFRLESIMEKPHQPQAPKLMPRCRDFQVSNQGEHRFESYTLSFPWLLSSPCLRRWKPAVLGRGCDMWINGNGIRFMHRAFPKVNYMFHALHTHVPDKTPGHATVYGTVDKLWRRPCMYHFWRTMVKWNRATEFCEILQPYPQNTMR